MSLTQFQVLGGSHQHQLSTVVNILKVLESPCWFFVVELVSIPAGELLVLVWVMSVPMS